MFARHGSVLVPNTILGWDWMSSSLFPVMIIFGLPFIGPTYAFCPVITAKHQNINIKT